MEMIVAAGPAIYVTFRSIEILSYLMSKSTEENYSYLFS